MKHTFDLWSFQGRVTRRQYVLAGVALLAIKYGLDSAVAAAFGRGWSPLMYVSPRVSPLLQPEAAPAFWLALLAVALPFIAAGVALSARRLRDMGHSPFWCGLFFLPFLHWVFFVVLAAAPSAVTAEEVPTTTTEEPGPPAADEEPRDLIDRFLALPGDTRFLIAGATGAAFGCGGLLVGSNLYLYELTGIALLPRDVLGVGLFVGVPFGVGFWPGYFLGLSRREGFGRAAAATTLASLVVFLLLLVVGLEGLGCLVMAAPLVYPVALLGAFAGWTCGRMAQLRPAAVAALLLAPGLIAWEQLAPPAPSELAVVSTVRIDAPPEAVWERVVAFPPIDAPPTPIFSIVALPLEARIEGAGPGALRRCIFTIGEFEEPIEVWDPPRELTFGVHAQPAAVARYVDTARGQFLLERNPDGSTTLVGTTWIRCKLQPAFYWDAWSEALVHAIHMRVLEHIERLAEGAAPAGPAELPEWLLVANETCRCTRHERVP